jgi:hypothetical protein
MQQSHDNADTLKGAKLRRPDDPGSFQDPAWQSGERQADNERGVGNGPDWDER